MRVNKDKNIFPIQKKPNTYQKPIYFLKQRTPYKPDRIW